MVTHTDASGTINRKPAAAPADGALLARDAARPDGEETLILDHRAHLGPAQFVEHKLSTLLGGALPPVSHVRMLTQLSNRNHC